MSKRLTLIVSLSFPQAFPKIYGKKIKAIKKQKAEIPAIDVMDLSISLSSGSCILGQEAEYK